MIWGYIELKNFYESLDHHSMQGVLAPYLKLKRDGYQKNYSQILALDIYDYIASHYIVWIEYQGKKTFVACTRAIDQATLNFYGLINPCQSLLNSIAKADDISVHQEYLHNRLVTFHNQSHRITYFNGWTVHPDYRKFEYSSLIKRASLATIGLRQKENQCVSILISGMPHLKTDQVLKSIGLQLWQHQGHELKELISPAFNSRTTVFFDFYGKFNTEYENELEFFKEKWNQRQIIQLDDLAQKPKAA